MTNCPKCGKPILNGGLFTSPAKFNIKCPWCQATLQINIQPRIVTEVIKLGNGETPKNGDPVRHVVRSEKAESGEDVDDIFTGLYSMQEPMQKKEEHLKPGIPYKLNGKGIKFVGYLYPDDRESG
ncbi:MAG: hypothetical protein HYW51_01890 [Candidatus Doudnabacteria bacterium]|nr:hypothetical protein [Candidatus Doudnabacteria bacterium]